jgi:hypothetical protein
MLQLFPHYENTNLYRLDEVCNRFEDGSIENYLNELQVKDYILDGKISFDLHLSI